MPIVVCDKCGAKNRVETQKAENCNRPADVVVTALLWLKV